MTVAEAKIVDEIFNAWSLNQSIKNQEVVDDVKNAIFEAYQRGASQGGMDSRVFQNALDYTKDLKTIK